MRSKFVKSIEKPNKKRRKIKNFLVIEMLRIL